MLIITDLCSNQSLRQANKLPCRSAL